MDWERQLTEIGALWHHDGHRERPYALLTSGMISAHYIDMSFAVARPAVIAKAARQLAATLVGSYGGSQKYIICGQQEGSTTLGSRIAEELDCGFMYTTKASEGADKIMVLAERFHGMFPEDSLVILVEDVTTTAGTSVASRRALEKVGFKLFRDIILTVVDRTNGRNEFGFEIISCLKAGEFISWKEGENPHVPNGKEIVEPVRPKTERGRKLMRRRI